MLPLVLRLPLLRSPVVTKGSSSLRLVSKRFQSFTVAERSAERQQQALLKGGAALVGIGITGYALNKLLNSPSIYAPSAATNWTGSKQASFADAVEANRAFPQTVREHLKSTYAHFAGGLAMTGSFAYLFHRSGWSTRIMMMNKWAYLGVTLVGTIGALFATQAVDDRQNPALKYGCWTLFNGAMGLSLAPLCFSQPALIARAALYTAGIVGSISAVGMTARREQYLWLGAPLMAGLVVVCLSSFGSILLPVTAVRTLSLMENVSVYGGLAVFSGLILYDTQKMIGHAEAQDSRYLSPINEALSIYLDAINIFVRLLYILEKKNRK